MVVTQLRLRSSSRHPFLGSGRQCREICFGFRVRATPRMAIIVATLLLFLAGPFVLWPLIKTPPEE